MKLTYLILLYILLFIRISNAQPPVPKVEKAYKYVPELIIKDSLFLQGIDSLIFNSFCPDIKKKTYKIFNIECTKKNNHYELHFAMLPTVQFHNMSKLQGCFKYGDYLFIWYGAIPENLLKLSHEKKRLVYLKNLPFIRFSLAEFAFQYMNKKLILTGMCCF